MLQRLVREAWNLLRSRSLRKLAVLVRYAWCRLRYGLRVVETHGSLGPTIGHNLRSLLSVDERVDRLLHGVLVLEDHQRFRTLAVGCRNENDLLLLGAYGIHDTVGLDLISYSPWIVPGDMHEAPFPDDSFDLVFFPYTLGYSRSPARCLAELVRVLRPGGFLAIAVEYCPAGERARIQQALLGYTIVPDRPIDTVDSILELLGAHLGEVVVRYDALRKRHHTEAGLIHDPSPIVAVVSIRK